MKTVGLAEAKAQLSALLDAGDEVSTMAIAPPGVLWLDGPR